MAGPSGHQEIARRYATAFFELAQQSGQIDQITADLETLDALIASGGDFSNLLNNATLRRDDQAKALAAIAQHYKLSSLTAKLLGVVAQKRRLPALPAIVNAVAERVAAHKGEITAEVTAAQALDQSQIDEIAQNLKKVLGKEVNVRLNIDPAIIGGLIIKVGSRLIDASVGTKLERLHRALKNSNETSDKAKMKEVA